MKKIMSLFILLCLSVGCTQMQATPVSVIYGEEIKAEKSDTFMKVTYLDDSDKTIQMIQFTGVIDEELENKLNQEDYLKLVNFVSNYQNEMNEGNIEIEGANVGFENFFKNEDSFYSIYILNQNDTISFSFRFNFTAKYDEKNEAIQALLKRFALDKAKDSNDNYSLEKYSKVDSSFKFYFAYDSQVLDAD